MDRPTYSANDVSHPDLIAYDFSASRRWSVTRRNQQVVDRAYRRQQVRDYAKGVAVAVFCLTIMLFLKATVGVL